MDFKELIVYKKAFALAMEVYEVSKSFPKEEKYSLTDQIRRSSRSVCANIAESYRKRLYIRHFISKLTDSDAENSETIVWLDFSVACVYLSKETHERMVKEAIEIGKLLNYMMLHPENMDAKMTMNKTITLNNAVFATEHCD
jgi:four helix bundle protein